MSDDPRYLAIRNRLELLTAEELVRLINDQEQWVLYDTYNYYGNKLCPIAVALNLHRTLQAATDERVIKAIEHDPRFRPANILKGLKGKFYTTNRKEDLKNVLQEVLQAKVLELEAKLPKGVEL